MKEKELYFKEQKPKQTQQQCNRLCEEQNSRFGWEQLSRGNL